MPERPPEGELREALFELQGYLSGQVAPLMVADAMEVLVRQPPGLLAAMIQGWVARQYSGEAAGVPVSDYLFHAVRKIHMISEFDLVDPAVLAGYVDGLVREILAVCPEPERESLASNIACLGRAEDASMPVEILHRPAPAGRDPAPPGPGPRAGAGAAGRRTGRPDPRRFSLLLGRLAGSAGRRSAPVTVSAAPDAELLAGLLVAAARDSSSAEELDELLGRIGAVGLDTRSERIFRLLGDRVPGWTAADGAWDEAILERLQSSGPLEAMRRIVTAASGAREGASRFNEMVQAAIERFNRGFLGQATAMLDLAERIVSERKLSADVTGAIRRRAHEGLSEERLREYADRPERHAALRKVLSFFPAMTVEGLMDSLFRGEGRRERRKLILALLEAHGAPARASALEQLKRCASEGVEDPEGFYKRNLVFLLRRIPRPSDAPLEAELDLLIPLTRPGTPELVAKEAIWTLGQFRERRAEGALLTRLRELEERLRTGGSGPDGADLLSLLDRTVSTLARHGSRNGTRAVATHALSRNPAFGDTMARIEGLSEHDLAGDPDLVDGLVEVLRQELPRKVLGLVVQEKESKEIVHLIRALSGTTAPAVRHLFEEIVAKFPKDAFARAAEEALAAQGATQRGPGAPARLLSGDLELFGLPNLLQSVAESRLSGTLTLSDEEGRTAATMTFESGMMARCQAGALRGESALYQLFEKPTPGSFVFRGQGGPSEPGGGEADAEPAAGAVPVEVLPAVLEALRRYDEFQQARAVVPDTLCLEATGKMPTRLPDEDDKEFLRSLWKKVSAGESALACEETLPVDSYRIRRQMAHWLEEGALKAVSGVLLKV